MNVPWDVYDSPVVLRLIEPRHIWWLTDKHLRGGLALLVSTNRAIREPSDSGTSDKLAPRFLLYVKSQYNLADMGAHGAVR